jgi:hypothetical protein
VQERAGIEFVGKLQSVEGKSSIVGLDTEWLEKKGGKLPLEQISSLITNWLQCQGIR